MACLEFAIRRSIIAWWLRRPTPTAEALILFPGEAKFILSYRKEIGV